MNSKELENEIRLLRSQLNADQSRLASLEKELAGRTPHTPPMPYATNTPRQTTQNQQQYWQPNQQSTPPMQMQYGQQSQQANQTPYYRQSTPPIQMQYCQQNQQNQHCVPPAQQWNPGNQQIKRVDYEKIIGKSAMGILACVLIFISIIMFAVVLIPFMADWIKLIIMYAVSCAFIGVGLYFYKKTNTLFYKILSACGMGSLYISILLSNIHFKLINDIVLYILILAWAGGIAALSKNNSRIFNIVGNIGLFIAICLGTARCIYTDDDIKFIVLLGFFILSCIIYGVFNRKFYIFNSCCNMLGIAVCTTGFMLIDSSNAAIFAILFIITAVQFVYLTYKRCEPYFIFYAILKILMYAILYVFIMCSRLIPLILLDFDQIIYSFVIYLISIMSICFINLYYRRGVPDNYYNKTIISVIDICFMTVVFLPLSFPNAVFVILLPIAFAIANIITSEKVYVYASLFTLFLGTLLHNSLTDAILIVACSIMIIAKYQKQQSTFSDVIRTISSFFLRWSIILTLNSAFILYNESDTIHSTVSILCIFVIDLLFKYKLSHNKNDKGIYYSTYFSNVYCSLWIIILLFRQSGFEYYLTMLVGVLVFMNNVIRFITSNQEDKQIYAMLKTTIYIIVVFVTMKSASIWMSITLFAMAIIYILIGFSARFKSVRLYGLVISIISIAKLLLIDIHYNYTVTRAFGFFICGIMAFAISFIYNRFEKNNQNVQNANSNTNINLNTTPYNTINEHTVNNPTNKS